MHYKQIDDYEIYTIDFSSPVSWSEIGHRVLDWFGLFSVVALPAIIGFFYGITR